MLVTLLVILFVIAFFYEAARRRNNRRVMNIFIGIGSFFIGSFIATIIADLITVAGFEISELIIRLPLWIICIWLVYRGLKSLLNPTRKTVKNSSLDSDLIQREEIKQ